MEAATVGIILVVIGLVFILVEAFSPGGYMLIPGLDLFVIGVYGWLMPDFLYTWVTVAMAIVLSIPVIVFTMWIYKHYGETAPPSTTVTGSLVGREGVVTVAVNTHNMRGKVKIGSDTWSAEADEDIPVGSDVIVDSSEGVHVHVKKV